MTVQSSQLESPPKQGRLRRWAVQGLVFLLVTWWLPAWWCGREADDWFAGQAQHQAAMLRSVEHWVDMELSSNDFGTGSELFNGEWLFGTYMMAAMGAGQMAIEQPDQREQCLAVMEKALDKLFAEQTRAFDRSQWGADAIETLDDPAQHHAAYLGYANMALSLHRLLKPESRYAELNDRITAALVARLDSSPLLLLETYPNEMYPVDNCAVIGSIGLYDRATGADHSDLLMRCEKTLRSDYIDDESGLMIQCQRQIDRVRRVPGPHVCPQRAGLEARAIHLRSRGVSPVVNGLDAGLAHLLERHGEQRVEDAVPRADAHGAGLLGERAAPGGGLPVSRRSAGLQRVGSVLGRELRHQEAAIVVSAGVGVGRVDRSTRVRGVVDYART